MYNPEGDVYVNRNIAQACIKAGKRQNVLLQSRHSSLLHSDTVFATPIQCPMTLPLDHIQDPLIKEVVIITRSEMSFLQPIIGSIHPDNIMDEEFPQVCGMCRIFAHLLAKLGRDMSKYPYMDVFSTDQLTGAARRENIEKFDSKYNRPITDVNIGGSFPNRN